jgi:hypothetical protein
MDWTLTISDERNTAPAFAFTTNRMPRLQYCPLPTTPPNDPMQVDVPQECTLPIPAFFTPFSYRSRQVAPRPCKPSAPASHTARDRPAGAFSPGVDVADTFGWGLGGTQL